jgi:hypothetical protein
MSIAAVTDANKRTAFLIPNTFLWRSKEERSGPCPNTMVSTARAGISPLACASTRSLSPRGGATVHVAMHVLFRRWLILACLMP